MRGKVKLDYYQVREWLESYIPLVYGKEELGLARIEELLRRLGNPERKFKSIHVAGTSGKGSTAYYIARLLQYSRKSEIRNQKSETNSKLQNSKSETLVSNFDIRASNLRPFKVGLHVSPHLSYIGERMQINGKAISVNRLIKLIELIRPVVEKIQKEKPESTPSYFEILVAASFLYFAQEKVDFAVVEVGLGGRLDATNVLMPEVAVITNVGLDHTEILGETVEEIAAEKAGIVKRDVPIVTGATGVALDVIKEVAKKKNAPLVSVLGSKYYVVSIGSHCTSETAGLAIKTVEVLLGSSPQGRTIQDAFSVGFPGRFEEVEKGVILDGAHNPQKIKALINFLRKCRVQSAECKVILVIGFKKGKKWEEMVDLLVNEFRNKNLELRIIATEFQAVTDTGMFAAVPAEEIARYASKVHGAKCKVIRNSQEAVWKAMATNDKRQTTNDLVIVTGSLYLVGEVRTMWAAGF